MTRPAGPGSVRRRWRRCATSSRRRGDGGVRSAGVPPASSGSTAIAGEDPGATAKLRALMRLRRPPLFPLSVAAGAFLFLGLFLLLPLGSVFWVSFYDASGTHFTLANYGKIATTRFYQQSLWNSVWIGVVATLTTTAVAVPLGFCIARLKLPGKAALTALSVLPLILPSFVGAYALVLMFGRSGVVTQLLRAIGVPF